jgi:single-strand DNA-binding protein
MSDLNKVLATGVIVQDVELRFLPDGTKTANLRVAIHRRYKNKTQEIKEETEFITVIVWQTTAENCAKYLKKGSRVFVEGRLQTREYVDKDQQKRIAVEIKAETVEFLDKPEKKELPAEG